MIFKEKKSFKEIYESLTNNVLKGDLIYYDTENVMSTENYRNDVSFLTEDGRAIVLVEHQSTRNMNMALRQLLYYAKILEIYISETNQAKKLHTNTVVSVPKPEFIVVYNGKAPIEDSNYSIDANFGEINDNFIIKSKIYNINYHDLSDKQKELKNALTGYSYLIDRVSYYYEHEKCTLSIAIDNAVEDCIINGYLLEYLKERREFVTMATIYLSDEDMQELRFEEGIEKGIEKAIIGMIDEGFDNNLISRVLKCDLDKIDEIRNKYAKYI